MKSFPNIEKSGFHKGQYVGYAEGRVYRITKTNSSYGNWCATCQEAPNEFVFAFRLEEMSEKLAAKAEKIKAAKKGA